MRLYYFFLFPLFLCLLFTPLTLCDATDIWLYLSELHSLIQPLINLRRLSLSTSTYLKSTITLFNQKLSFLLDCHALLPTVNYHVAFFRAFLNLICEKLTFPLHCRQKWICCEKLSSWETLMEFIFVILLNVVRYLRFLA